MNYTESIEYLKKRVCTECKRQTSPVICPNSRCGYKKAMEKAVDAMETLILMGNNGEECEACKL